MGLCCSTGPRPATALAAENNDPEGAIDRLREGLKGLRDFLTGYDIDEQKIEEDGMVEQLRKMEESLRKLHNIEATLREQLEQAVANEQYEMAAKLRDALKRRE